MTQFNELGLSPQMLAAVEAQGYSTPTPIQQQAIPVILNGNDLFATAPTGTGKTAAFAIPILQNLDLESKKIQALILAPTRELAHQISDNFKKYGAQSSVKITLIYGGVPQFRQVDSLKRGAHIVIATPGRLLDLINQGFVKLSNVKTFVLDECDRMLDMGFIDDIREIGAYLKEENKQTLLFSATASREIRTLSEELLKSPEKIDIVPSAAEKPKIDQWLFAVGQKNKEELLLQLLEDDDIDAMLVFTRTKMGADKLVNVLRENGHKSVAIHGDKSQRDRNRNLDSFKQGRDRILVATDVAARGVDIKSLNYVLNFDMAEDTETYTHRIGRTGRAGTEGLAMSFCSPGEAKHLHELQKLFGDDVVTEMDHDFRIELPAKRSGGSQGQGGVRSGGGYSRGGSRGKRPHSNHHKDPKPAGESKTDRWGKSSGGAQSNRSYSKKRF